ncbi:MAG: hypothetical protein NTU63_00660 [Candidatus Pacearchaeota archaeon]|nr:hypothetical protein [Candidatus Pacearchaeota archaeon]
MRKLTAYFLEVGDEEKLKRLLERRGYCIFENGGIVQANDNTPGKFDAVIYHYRFPPLACVVLHGKDSKLKKLLEDFKG